MWNPFKRRSEKDKLEAQYEKLLQESHKLSTSSRKLADQKMAEAQAILEKIELLESA